MRRKRILRRLVADFSVAPANVDERLRRGESFRAACVRLADVKARKAAEKRPNALVVGADTIAYLEKKNCRKTKSRRVAASILRTLSGKWHSVLTGVAIVFPSGKAVKYSVLSRVKMKRLDAGKIAGYLKTDDWRGRAGSYDASGKHAKMVIEKIVGERENVVGLPVRRLRKILEDA